MPATLQNDGGSWGVVNEKLASILSVTDSSVLGREKIPFISDTTRTMVSHVPDKGETTSDHVLL